MDKNTLWSLRLGNSAKQANAIENMGLNDFLNLSFDTKFDSNVPAFLEKSPKSINELKEVRKKLVASNPDAKKDLLKVERQTTEEMKVWWIDKMEKTEFPLREKMTCFWHNHYVATFQKVKVNYWVFQHNQILRENAFGNFKTLTKKIIQTNAMVRYLDNVDNRKDKLNENLSRELLELFTLGIGNYTEEDIKNGAKGLAGLGIGEDKAIYRKFFEDNESFSYLGKKGVLKVDEMVDTIFDQPNIPYLITRKILKWFIYDTPKEELVRYYGDYFKKNNFEIKPLLTKIFTEEYPKNNAGSKIKSPLEYILQLKNELNIETTNGRAISYFLKQQGMDLFNQPNVKGWDGGNAWLTSQVFLQRNTIADLLCNGKNFDRRGKIDEMDSMMNKKSNRVLNVKLNWNSEGDNKDIISELANRSLFTIDANEQKDFEQLLKYDFDPKTAGSEYAVMRLFNYMVKTPEYQLI
ncbi:DUF1800 domain-containing protein [Flavobacterium cellulosilyticum]|uniref:DUF1800 domain-containing protein n=1 Tax=Flavobacterium cellulosilyticum TaxID=2541731 RepID=A0A4R5CJ64_9FLAO|nr:DUF1800 domain-containing protein [Flavobacterium cellulosilyticum]TDD97394.1 DUF1800 domain-containing protein [Flavobacterium cellulosilyticum]